MYTSENSIILHLFVLFIIGKIIIFMRTDIEMFLYDSSLNSKKNYFITDMV